MKNKKWIIAIVVLLLAAVLLIWRPWRVKAPAEGTTEPVEAVDTNAAEPAQASDPSEEAVADPADVEGDGEAEASIELIEPEEAEEIAEGDEQGGL